MFAKAQKPHLTLRRFKPLWQRRNNRVDVDVGFKEITTETEIELYLLLLKVRRKGLEGSGLFTHKHVASLGS